jgi:hypothetical protein
VDLKAKGWGGMDWIHLVQYPIGNMVMSLQVSSNIGKFFVAEKLFVSQEGLGSTGLAHMSRMQEIQRTYGHVINDYRCGLDW